MTQKLNTNNCADADIQINRSIPYMCNWQQNAYPKSDKTGSSSIWPQTLYAIIFCWIRPVSQILCGELKYKKEAMRNKGMNWIRAYHRRSIKIIDPASMVMGLSSFSICSTEFIDLPIPPCIQIIFFSISAASGRVLKSWLNRVHAHIPSFSPCTHTHRAIYKLLVYWKLERVAI